LSLLREQLVCSSEQLVLVDTKKVLGPAHVHTDVPLIAGPL